MLSEISRFSGGTVGPGGSPLPHSWRQHIAGVLKFKIKKCLWQGRRSACAYYEDFTGNAALPGTSEKFGKAAF